MPVASRADCTEMDVEELLYFHYDGSGTGEGGWKMTVEDVEMTFNACQGTNRQGNADNNDLWAYANRLYMEGRLSADVLNRISKNLVGDNPNVCHHAEQQMMSFSRYKVGYEAEEGWVKVAGRDEFEMEAYYGPIVLQSILASATEPIMHRVCQTCEPTHQHIYIKRLTGFPEFDPEEGLDLIYHLTYERSSTPGNVWGTDFEMYSTYEDALAGTNPWKCPNNAYNYGAGFPGECSPTGDKVRSQTSRWGDTGSRRNVAFYVRSVEPALDLDSVRSVNIGGYKGPQPGTAYAESRSPKTIHIVSTAGDMWNTADQLQFVKYNMRGMNDMVITVYIKDFFYQADWSKAGLVLRESMEPGARNVAMLMTGRKGVVLQSRSETDGSTSTYSWGMDDGEKVPMWFRLVVKGGNTFTFYNSTDGGTWSQFEEPIVIEDFSTAAMVGGLAASTNTWRGEPVEAVFDSFTYERVTWPTVRLPPDAPTEATTSTDIGNIGNQEKHIGTASYAPSTSVYSVTAGANTDIAGNQDRMHFLYFTTSGDFEIKAYVYNVVEPSNNSGKYGIMIRSSLEANAANAYCLMRTARSGPYGQVRPTDGGNTVDVDRHWGRPGTDAAWLGLKRTGNTIEYSYSLDGLFWDRFAVRQVTLPDQVYVGMALSSNHWNEQATASFKDWELVSSGGAGGFGLF